MITDLLTQNGRVIGAMGFPMEADTAIIITAKATILCTGAGTFKSYGFPISCLTFDGDAMAYRAGAEITGKEFVDTAPRPGGIAHRVHYCHPTSYHQRCAIR